MTKKSLVNRGMNMDEYVNRVSIGVYISELPLLRGTSTIAELSWEDIVH